MRVALVERSTEQGNPVLSIRITMDPESVTAWLGRGEPYRERFAYWLADDFRLPWVSSREALLARIKDKSIPIVNIPVKIVNERGSEETPCTESETN